MISLCRLCVGGTLRGFKQRLVVHRTSNLLFGGVELPGASTRMEFNVLVACNFFYLCIYVIIYFMFHSIVKKKIKRCGFVNHAEIRYFYIFFIAGD